MTPAERERLARTRFVILSASRATGAVLMALGLWIGLGDIVRAGGWPALGFGLFAIGFFEGLVLPPVLLRRWRG